MSDRTTPITRRQEIALVTGRELRAHLLKKSTIILTLVLLIAAIGGIVGIKLYTSGQDQAYRVGLKGVTVAQATGLDKVAASNGETIELVDVSAHQAKDVLADDAPEGTPHVDMVLDVSGSAPPSLWRSRLTTQSSLGSRPSFSRRLWDSRSHPWEGTPPRWPLSSVPPSRRSRRSTPLSVIRPTSARATRSS